MASQVEILCSIVTIIVSRIYGYSILVQVVAINNTILT